MPCCWCMPTSRWACRQGHRHSCENRGKSSSGGDHFTQLFVGVECTAAVAGISQPLQHWLCTRLQQPRLGSALQHITRTPWEPLLLVCSQLAAAFAAADLSPQDLPGALSDAEIAEAMGLHDIRNRDWAIFKTSAIKGDGLFEGLDWLANTLKTRGR